jgi:hypothetical protein
MSCTLLARSSTFAITLTSVLLCCCPDSAQANNLPKCASEAQTADSKLSYRERVTRAYIGRGNFQQFQREWNSNLQREIPIDVSSVGDHFPTLQPTTVCEQDISYFKDSHNILTESVILSSVVFVFAIPISDRETHTLKIAIPRKNSYKPWAPASQQTFGTGKDALKWIQGESGFKLERIAIETAKILPLATVRATSMIKFHHETGQYHQVQGRALDNSFTIFPRSLFYKDSLFQMTILHEHGHNVGDYFHRDLLLPLWEEAKSRDAKLKMGYIRSVTHEDFADTFESFVNPERRKYHADNKTRSPSRWLALELLFSKEKGGLQENSFWHNMSYYTRSPFY